MGAWKLYKSSIYVSGLCDICVLILFRLMVLLFGLGNNANDIGKFQCGFENDVSSGEIDLFKILLLFIVFEIEMVFILIWMVDVGIIFVVIVVLMLWEVVYGEI